jgi:hypothetical protein
MGKAYKPLIEYCHRALQNFLKPWMLANGKIYEESTAARR